MVSNSEHLNVTAIVKLRSLRGVHAGIGGQLPAIEPLLEAVRVWYVIVRGET
jgi:hypothetical protein